MYVSGGTCLALPLCILQDHSCCVNHVVIRARGWTVRPCRDGKRMQLLVSTSVCITMQMLAIPTFQHQPFMNCRCYPYFGNVLPMAFGGDKVRDVRAFVV